MNNKVAHFLLIVSEGPGRTRLNHVSVVTSVHGADGDGAQMYGAL